MLPSILLQFSLICLACCAQIQIAHSHRISNTLIFTVDSNSKMNNNKDTTKFPPTTTITTNSRPNTIYLANRTNYRFNKIQFNNPCCGQNSNGQQQLQHKQYAQHHQKTKFSDEFAFFKYNKTNAVTDAKHSNNVPRNWIFGIQSATTVNSRNHTNKSTIENANSTNNFTILENLVKLLADNKNLTFQKINKKKITDTIVAEKPAATRTAYKERRRVKRGASAAMPTHESDNNRNNSINREKFSITATASTKSTELIANIEISTLSILDLNLVGSTTTLADNTTNYNNTENFEVPEIPAYIRTTAMVFCIIIMILGVVGNIMVPIVIMKTKDMRNSTNIFLTNLSIADLLVLLVCTPTVLVEVNTRPETWILGHEMCKAVPFVELTVAHASVLTILAISFERYYAICEPLKAGYVCTKARAILICILAWGIAALFTSPILWVAEYKYVEYIDGSSVAVCLTQAISNWTIAYFLMTTSAFFVVPLFILIVLYWIIAKNLISNKGPMVRIRPTKPELSLKARKQVVFMLGAVVLSFFLCLLPFRVLTIWIILSSEQTFLDIGIERYYSLLYFCRVMLYLNSAGNPILYNLMSTKFRKGFYKLSCSTWQCIMMVLTCCQRKRIRSIKGHHQTGSGTAAGIINTTTTSSNTTTTTSSSMLSRSSNRRSSDDLLRTRVQIQMQIPCGNDNEMLAMLHAGNEFHTDDASVTMRYTKRKQKSSEHRRKYSDGALQLHANHKQSNSHHRQHQRKISFDAQA